jgi:hypothetical protein
LDSKNEGLAEYKAFIDGLVELARQECASAVRLQRGMQFYPVPPAEDVKYNEFVAGLTPEQQHLLADLIQRERYTTIGDMLGFLTWKKYRLSKGEVELATEPFYTENFYDFTCRMEGDTWPDERDKQSEENT